MGGREKAHAQLSWWESGKDSPPADAFEESPLKSNGIYSPPLPLPACPPSLLGGLFMGCCSLLQQARMAPREASPG